MAAEKVRLRRLTHDRPAHRHPLALPSGQLPGFAAQLLFDVQECGGLLNAGLDLLFRLHPSSLSTEMMLPAGS